MTTISPKVRSQFDSLSPALQNAILAKNVSINTLYDLIGVLDEIIREAEALYSPRRTTTKPPALTAPCLGRRLAGDSPSMAAGHRETPLCGKAGILRAPCPQRNRPSRKTAIPRRNPFERSSAELSMIPYFYLSGLRLGKGAQYPMISPFSMA